MKIKLTLILPYLALIFFILGAKFAYIYHYGLNMPFYDQWAPEATLLNDWYNGHQLTTLFDSFGEHRIFFTRLVILGLIILNNQWDVLLEMTVNCFFHIACAVLLFKIVQNLFGKIVQFVGFILITLLFMLPFTWENTLWGFQSQFYFLEFFSILAIYYLVSKPSEPKNIIMGWVFVLFAMLNMGSGFFPAISVVAVALLYLIFKQSPKMAQLLQLAIGLVFIAIGFLMISTPMDESLKAHSASQFLIVLHQYLTWPFSVFGEGLSACVLKISFIPFVFGVYFLFLFFFPQYRTSNTGLIVKWACFASLIAIMLVLPIIQAHAKAVLPLSIIPWKDLDFSFLDFSTYLNASFFIIFYKIISCFVFLIVFIFTLFIAFFPGFRSRKNYFILGFSIWVFMQMLALAYGRNLYGIYFSRYTDLVSLWLLVYLFCLASIFQFIQHQYPALYKSKWSMIAGVCIALSMIALLYGLLVVTVQSLGSRMPHRKMSRISETQVVRGYMQSKDPAYLDNKIYQHSPYTEYERGFIKKVLDRESIRYYLGAEIREHLPMASATDGVYFKFNECTLLPGKLSESTVGPYYTNYNNQQLKSFISKPIHAVVGLPYIKLWVTGNGQAQVFIKSEATGKIVDSVKVNLKENEWNDIDLKQPSSSYQIQVQAADNSSWFAVTAPREQGRLSNWIKPILSSYAVLFILGLVLSIYWLRTQWTQLKNEKSFNL